MALPKPRLLTVEEAATRGAALANAGGVVPLVALDLIDDVDPDEWRGLAAQGLQRAIHDRLYAERQYAADVEGATEDDGSPGIRHLLPKPTHPARDFWLLPLSQSYQVIGGRRQVLDFTLADFEHAEETYRARGYGNLQKADAFKLGKKLMREHRADLARNLPIPAQQSIGEALR